MPIWPPHTSALKALKHVIEDDKSILAAADYNNHIPIFQPHPYFTWEPKGPLSSAVTVFTVSASTFSPSTAVTTSPTCKKKVQAQLFKTLRSRAVSLAKLPVMFVFRIFTFQVKPNVVWFFWPNEKRHTLSVGVIAGQMQDIGVILGTSKTTRVRSCPNAASVTALADSS